MNYLNRLNQTADESAKESNELINDSAHLTLQSEMLKLRKAISEQKSIVNNLKKAIDYSPNSIYTADNAMALLQRKLEFFVNLEQEEFSKEPFALKA